jgi:DNA invertase Pin-like site-specific DNA recombinase
VVSGQRVGYIRVSSLGQNPDRQLDGVEVDTLFTDTISGKSTARPQLKALLGFVRDGDTVIVHSMDRLARNLDDLRRLVRELTGRGVRVQFVNEQLTFTGEHSRWLSCCSRCWGRSLSSSGRSSGSVRPKGLALAKARGAYKGRKRSLTPGQVEALRDRAAAGEPKARLARELGISRQTLPLPVPTPATTVGLIAGQDGAMPKSAAPAVCADSAAGDTTLVYRLRVVIHGVSPQIWRRLLVPATATIAQLHAIVQTAFGWGGEHLHRFVIHGVEYGICYVGGPGFRDDARTVRLGELGLRAGERFTYHYNFTAGWQADLRVEHIQPGEPGRAYPRCTGGRRAGPPEEWGGPWTFVEQTQPYLVFNAIVRAAEIMGPLLDADEDDMFSLGEYRDELASLLPLLSLERFDRRACNNALAACAAPTKEVGA